jgi:hypothetical protein
MGEFRHALKQIVCSAIWGEPFLNPWTIRCDGALGLGCMCRESGGRVIKECWPVTSVYTRVFPSVWC